MATKSKNQKFTRNAGGQEFGHGAANPKDLGPTEGNQVVPGRHQVSTVPSDAGKFDQRTGVAPKSDE